MSDKSAELTIYGEDETTGQQIGFCAVVDFINPGYVYLSLDDGERCAAVALPDADARALAEFILKETRSA